MMFERIKDDPDLYVLQIFIDTFKYSHARVRVCMYLKIFTKGVRVRNRRGSYMYDPNNRFTFYVTRRKKLISMDNRKRIVWRNQLTINRGYL